MKESEIGKVKKNKVKKKRIINVEEVNKFFDQVHGTKMNSKLKDSIKFNKRLDNSTEKVKVVDDSKINETTLEISKLLKNF